MGKARRREGAQDAQFSRLFSKQSSLIQNRRKIPSVRTPVTDKSHSSFQFAANGIKSIINKLHPNKGYGHKPLEMIFRSCLNQGIVILFSRMVKKLMYYQCIKKGIINV